MSVRCNEQRPWGLRDSRLTRKHMEENKKMLEKADFKFDEENKYLDKDGNPVMITVLPSSGKRKKQTMRCKG